MANNRFTIEVEETGTGRTKQEIIRLLDETKAKASEASRSLSQLKIDSINHAEAVSRQASAVRQLGVVRAREIQSLKELQQSGVPYLEGLKAASSTLREYQRRLSETTKEKNKLISTNNADASRLLQLKVQEKNYSDVVKVAKDEVQRYKQSLSELSEKKQQHVQNSRVLSSQLVTEKASLSQATDAQQAHNRAKQKAQIDYNKLEGNVRTLNKELKILQREEAASERETRRMDAATLALANTVGYAAYNAIRNFIEQIKDFIVNATIYASRTDEMRLAMLNMSKQSGVSRGELLQQAEAMRRMNITTQETYETLTKFQLAQLDVSKATEIARVAQDLAVIAGVETGEEVNRLVHGITTLQIRVLRTAGVFVSLEQSMKEAALTQGRSTESFSEAEKQQILLNKVLEVGARAAGNYETSLDNAGKRMRSMVRIFQDMQNAVGGLLQGPFGNLVDILSGLMTLVSAAPKVFAGLTIVLIALGIQIVRNFTYTARWLTTLRALIVELSAATKAALGLNMATTTQAGTVNNLTSRWGTFKTALSGIISVAGRLILVTAALNAVMETGAQIAKAAGGVTKFNTEDLKNQTVTIDELRAAEQRLQELRQRQEQRKQEGYSDKYGRAQGFFGRLEEVVVSGLSVVGGREFLLSSSVLNQRLQDAQDNVDLLKAKLDEQGESVAVLSALQREYSEQVAKAGKSNLDFSATSEIINIRLDRIKKQFEELAKPIDKDTGLILTLAERLNVLKPEILDLDTVFQKIATSQEDYNRLIAEAEQRFPGFTDMLRILRSEGEKYIEGIGEAEAEAARRFIDIQRRLRSAIREIYGLFGQGNQQELRAGNLELLEKRLQIVRQEIDSIVDARINLNRDLGEPIPQDREARLSLQNTYETAIKVRDEIRAAQRANKDFVADVVKAQQLASSARTTAIKTELIAAKLIAENQTKRIQDERQMTAEIVALTKQRADAAKDETGTQRQAYASFYKEQLENLIATEDQTRRLKAELSFIKGETVSGLNVPEFGLGGVTTALENIALPATTQAENVATITQSVQNIEKAVMAQTPVDVMGTTGLSGETIKMINPKGKGLPLLTGEVVSAAKKYGINPNLLVNLAYQESGVRQYDEYGKVITSSAGALGTMQLMPGTAARYGADPYKTAENIDAGARYLADLLKMFNGRIDLALAGYNAGEFVKKAPGGGTIVQREKRLNSLIAKNEGVRNYVENVTGQNILAGGYNLYAPVTSPKLIKGAEGAVFPQTGSSRITNLTPEQIIQSIKTNAEEQNRLNKEIQDGYTGSQQATVDYYATIEQTNREAVEQFKTTQTEMRVIDQQTAEGFYETQEYKTRIFNVADLARKRTALATHDIILQLDKDERDQYRESAQYQNQVNQEAQIRIRQAFNDSRDILAAVQAEQNARTKYHQQYITTIHNNAEASRLKSTQATEDRYNEMLEESNSTWRKSTEFKLSQWRMFEVGRYEETKRVEDSIEELHDQIKHATDLDPLKAEEARLRAVLEVRQADGVAKAEMEANSVRLADMQIYHADRANAKVMEYLAQQRSTDQVFADARINTMELVFGTIDSGLDRITDKLGIFGSLVKDVISGLARLALSKVFMALFGLSPSTQQPQQSTFNGGIISSIMGSVGVGLPGTGFPSGVAGGTPPFVPSGIMMSGGYGMGNASTPQQAAQQAIANIFRGAGGFESAGIGIPIAAGRAGGTWGDLSRTLPVYSNGTWGTGGAGKTAGFFGSLAASLPFLGVGLGSQLGGSSRLGSVLGAAGGGILGLGGAAILGSSTAASALGAIGSLGGLLPFTIGAPFLAAPLIIGAILLSRNKKRRENEKKRDQFTTDALSRLNSLLSQVRRDTVSGEEALAQAASIRQQYVESANALNDKKTRNIALKDVSRLDAIISQIKSAAKGQERRRELDEQLVPEFAGGGRVPISSGRGGIVPGTDLGYDNVLALLRPGEVVLNRRQQTALGGPAVLAAAGVPNFVKQTALAARRYAQGGYSSNPLSSSITVSDKSDNRDINVFIVTDKKYAEQMAEQGKDKIITLAANDFRDKGRIYSAVRKM